MSISVQNVAVCLSRVAAMLGLIASPSVAVRRRRRPATQGNAIERVDAIQTSSGVVVSIELKNAPQGVPASFSVANPARVALDMPATVNGLGKNMRRAESGRRTFGQRGAIRRSVARRCEPQAGIDTYGVVEGKRVLVALGGAADTSTFRAAPGTSSSHNGASVAIVPSSGYRRTVSIYGRPYATGNRFPPRRRK